MAATSPSASSTMAEQHQENDKSTIVQPPRSHPLPERPPPVHAKPRPRHAKPRSICRNFIFWGSCRDMQCPRAHVPHKVMLDLFDYLLEREDCPSELRSIRRRFTRPSPGMNREGRRSDQICSNFLESDGFCRWQNKCFRAHLRSTQIYFSLLQSPKTSAVPPVPAADEHPVVETQEPLLADNVSPLPAIVQRSTPA